MTLDEMANELRPYVRQHVPGGGEQFLDRLLALAEVGTAAILGAELASARLDDETFDRQVIAEHLIITIQRAERDTPRATVILFKPSGKYYTEEQWRIPLDVPRENGHGRRAVIGPYDMEHSPDFHRIDGGAVLVSSQEPWGYPFLLLQS